ncbi:response regulator [Kutzneria sp. NPDC052558]|uniref:response regulator n=1 Tax=Kutzneria sp. NPDC052558 TaxID=3364121 RepID=UPI0037CB682A
MDTFPPYLQSLNTILVVDPFPMVQATLRDLLLRSGTAASVQCVNTADAALARCSDGQVDLVITDVDLTARRDGIRLCQKAKALPSPPLVLVLSSSNDPDIVAECISSRADSFVHRTADLKLVLSAIETVVDSQPIWFLGANLRDRTATDSEFSAIVANLTVREREILSLVLMRFSNDEIATRLCLARQTVKNYVSGVLQKLDFASRAELFASPFGAKYVDVVHRLVSASNSFAG